MDLPTRLAQGVQALRDGDAQIAAELLEPVALDVELAQATDLVDVRARVLTLYVQALLAAGRASAARHPLRDARELLEALGDPGGLSAVAELEAQVGQAISESFQAAARRRTLREVADQDLDARLARAEPSARASVLVEHATAALEVGRDERARELADRALDLADQRGDLRHQVMALLVQARLSDQPATVLEAARRRADEGDDFNLVGFVVKAANELGITLTSDGGHG